jgi:alkylhydroperoxidase family enzyme
MLVKLRVSQMNGCAYCLDMHAPDEVFRLARSQFSERELTDLSIAIAMINVWNRLAIGVRAEHPNDRAAAA